MTLALCFHHVTPIGGEHATVPERFHDHLNELRRAGFGFVDFDTFSRTRLSGRRLPRRTVLVTTDDGYADNWYWAWPVLRDLGVPSVFFVITGSIGDGSIRNVAYEGTRVVVPDHEGGDGRFMRWSELRALHRTGLVSVQSHTHLHTRRVGADDKEKLRVLGEDISTSCERIETEVGLRPLALAWPWGQSSAHTRSLACELGLHMQFTVTPGGIGPWSSSRLMSRLCADERDTAWLLDQARRITAPLIGDAYSIARVCWNLARQAHTRRIGTAAGAA